MSGTAISFPCWSEAEHELWFRALLKAAKIPYDSPNALQKLRAVPERQLAALSSSVNGVTAGSCLPCDDGFFLDAKALYDPDRTTEIFPQDLESYMVGDARDEGMIFGYDISLDGNDRSYLLGVLLRHMSSDAASEILKLYQVGPELPTADIQHTMCLMAADAIFHMPTWLSAQRSPIKSTTYAYHFDQESTIPGEGLGLAHHAHDLMYIFGNWPETPGAGQLELSRRMQNAYIRFAYGKEPWECFESRGCWKTWGPDCTESLQKEEHETSSTRRYQRMKEIVRKRLWKEFAAAMDEVAYKRSKIKEGL
ncbi:hypothetical protein ACJQWK_04146 [Exserohilum turcicum]